MRAVLGCIRAQPPDDVIIRIMLMPEQYSGIDRLPALGTLVRLTPGKETMIRHPICCAAIGLLISTSAALSEDAPDALSAEWQGTKPCEKLDEDAQVRILRCTFPTGGGQAKHSHPAQFSYVLSGGKLAIEDEKGTRQAEPKTGGSGVAAPIPWHAVKNVGDTTIVFLVVEKKYQPVAK
jgi:quercetin dioxygenase-like cupin family protein